MGDNTLRALSSDLAYLEAGCLAATGRPLPQSAARKAAAKFIAQQLWEPARREGDPEHGMPADVERGLPLQGPLRSHRPHAPATVRRRFTSWSILTRWRGHGGAFSSPSLKAALRLAVRATSGPKQRKSERAATGDLLARLTSTAERLVDTRSPPE